MENEIRTQRKCPAAADWVSHCHHWRTVDSSRLVTPNILWQTLRPQTGLVRAGTCDAAQTWLLSIEARPEQPDPGLVRWLGLSLSLPAAMAGCEASVHSTDCTTDCSTVQNTARLYFGYKVPGILPGKAVVLFIFQTGIIFTNITRST